MEKSTLIVHIGGMVQGVGFRHFVYKKTHAYNEITGYVENLPDGRVKIYAEGPESQLRSFLSDVKNGPSFAKVNDVEVNWAESEKNFDRFFIKSGYGL